MPDEPYKFDPAADAEFGRSWLKLVGEVKDDRPSLNDIDDDTDIQVSIILTLPGAAFKAMLRKPFDLEVVRGRNAEAITMADAIRGVFVGQYKDATPDDSETIQKAKPGHVEGVDRPRYGEYSSAAEYKVAMRTWRKIMRALGIDPNDLPIYPDA